jgi:hypothetical protein
VATTVADTTTVQVSIGSEQMDCISDEGYTVHVQPFILDDGSAAMPG